MHARISARADPRGLCGHCAFDDRPTCIDEGVIVDEAVCACLRIGGTGSELALGNEPQGGHRLAVLSAAAWPDRRRGGNA